MPPHRADPHSHSRDPPSSSRELTTLRTELELSTFLNKGILQSNAELKARIAELEAENAALRSSESQLSRTEDALEVAEKRVHRAELSAAAAERRYTDELGRVVGEQAAAERDAEAWRRKYEELAGVLVEAQRVLGRIDVSRTKGDVR
jgi:chromosome segregation ATPase